MGLKYLRYGQTGTGKTFTMEGERSTGLQGNCSWSEDPFSGIIPRTLHMLFDKLEGQDFNVRVSYIEIYNEEIMDLMADNLGSDCAQKVKIFEDNNKKVRNFLQVVHENYKGFNFFSSYFSKKKLSLIH